MALATVLALASGLAMKPDNVSLPPPLLEIAARIAGEGMPHCELTLTSGERAPCLPDFGVRRGGGVNGWSRSHTITFTRGATERLTRDEFALLAGHEIAHYYLGHTANTPANELAADRMGAELACRAGFDPAAGVGLFRHLRPSRVHPKAEVRRAAVLAAGCANQHVLVSGSPGQPAKAPNAAIISGLASRLGSDPSHSAAALRMASNQGSNRPGSISWKSTGFSAPTGSQ